MRDYLVGLRKRANKTLRDVGEKLNISAGAYSHIEKGYRQEDMTLSMIEGLANAYNVTPEEIMRLEQEYRAQRNTA